MSPVSQFWVLLYHHSHEPPPRYLTGESVRAFPTRSMHCARCVRFPDTQTKIHGTTLTSRVRHVRQTRNLSVNTSLKLVSKLVLKNATTRGTQRSSERPFSLNNKINDAFEKFFPEKIRKKKYFNRLPWLTTELKNDIKLKNKCFIHYKKHPSQTNLIAYKDYKRELNRKLRSAKR